jgi:hypothetical protein
MAVVRSFDCDVGWRVSTGWRAIHSAKWGSGQVVGLKQLTALGG